MKNLSIRYLNSKNEQVRLQRVLVPNSATQIELVQNRLTNRISAQVAGENHSNRILRTVPVSDSGRIDLNESGLSLIWTKSDAVDAKLPVSIGLEDNSEKDRKRLTYIGKWTAGAQLGLVVGCLLLTVFVLKPEVEEAKQETQIVVIPKPKKEQQWIRTVKLADRIEPVRESQNRKAKSQVPPQLGLKTSRLKAVRSPQPPKEKPIADAVFSALDQIGRNDKSRGNRGSSSLQDVANGAGFAGGLGGESKALKGDLVSQGDLDNRLTRAGSRSGTGSLGGGGAGQGQGISTRGGGSTYAGFAGPAGRAGRGLSDGMVTGYPGESAVRGGGLTRDQVEAVMRRNIGQIRYCYEKSLQSSPDLRGRVSVDFTIESAGRVNAASVKNSSVGSSELESCVVAQLKRFQFPKPVAGVHVQVEYPFHFKRQG